MNLSIKILYIKSYAFRQMAWRFELYWKGWLLPSSLKSRIWCILWVSTNQLCWLWAWRWRIDRIFKSGHQKIKNTNIHQEHFISFIVYFLFPCEKKTYWIENDTSPQFFVVIAYACSTLGIVQCKDAEWGYHAELWCGRTTDKTWEFHSKDCCRDRFILERCSLKRHSFSDSC